MSNFAIYITRIYKSCVVCVIYYKVILCFINHQRQKALEIAISNLVMCKITGDLNILNSYAQNIVVDLNIE